MEEDPFLQDDEENYICETCGLEMGNTYYINDDSGAYCQDCWEDFLYRTSLQFKNIYLI